MTALKNMIGVFLLTTLSGCINLSGRTKTVTLENGRSRAPVDQSVFKNKQYFSKDLLENIDTTVIYEQFDRNPYEGMVRQKPVLARYNYKDLNSFYGVYRFYGNGCFSLFHLDRNDTSLTKQMFDPAYTGWRGVLYKKKQKILGDMFTQVGGMPNKLGVLTEEFTVKGDTLFVEKKNSHKYTYVKRSIPKTLLEQRSAW